MFDQQSSRRKNIPQTQRERNEKKYDLSRWTPYVKTVMEDLLDEKLDEKTFPYFKNKPSAPSYASARFTLYSLIKTELFL